MCLITALAIAQARFQNSFGVQPASEALSPSQVPEEDRAAEDADAHVAGVAGAQEGHGRLQDHDAADQLRTGQNHEFSSKIIKIMNFHRKIMKNNDFAVAGTRRRSFG